MDDELKNLKCNICQLAAITGLHRQTVVSRLSGVPLALGSNEKNKLYHRVCIPAYPPRISWSSVRHQELFALL